MDYKTKKGNNMKLGIYVSKVNGELFELIGELLDCYLVRFGQFEISAISKKDLNKIKCDYLGEL